MKYILFADESHITNNRFCSLAAVSLPCGHYNEVNNNLSNILARCGVSELKWKKLKNKKHYSCAEAIITFIVKKVRYYDLRIDVLVWDMLDSRHRIAGRDDLANCERMMFHLFKNTMKMRPQGSSWHIVPDENNGIDWDAVHECLSRTGKKRDIRNLLFMELLTDPHFVIRSFLPGDSKSTPLIQVADLFSGLSVFSIQKYPEYLSWKEQHQKQIALFNAETVVQLSNKEEFRSELLDVFYNMCKKYKLGVSLHKHKRLKTFKRSGPFNFWLYEPQGDYDKAPTHRKTARMR